MTAHTEFPIPATQLGSELRRLRLGRHETGEAVAAALGWSVSKVSRVETGRIGLRIRDAERLLDYYGITGTERDYLLDLTRRKRAAPWWDGYRDVLPPGYPEFLRYEQDACAITSWHPGAMPALLQTEACARATAAGYARAAVGRPALAEEMAAELAEVHMARQALLDRDPAPWVTMLVAEAVLRRPGDGGVMREQLQHMADRAQGLPSLTLRILPESVQLGLPGGSFAIFRFAADGRHPAPPDIVATEHPRGIHCTHAGADVLFCGRAFYILAQAALSPEESRALILDVAKSY